MLLCVLQSTALYTVHCMMCGTYFLAELESKVRSPQYEVPAAAAAAGILLHRSSMLGECLAATTSQNKLPALRDIFS
jgi:hypothetical protein